MSTTGPTPPGNWFDHLINTLAVIAGVLMCLLTVLVCVDVAVRNFRLFAMPWSLEVAEYSLLVVTFLGAPWVLVTGGHISIDILIDRLAPDARRRMRLASYALGALVCAVLLGFSTGAWWNSFSDGTMVVETFVFPEWLFFAIPPPIFLMLGGIFVRWIRDPPEASGFMNSDGF